MKLPPNIHNPAVEAAIQNAKEAFSSYAIDCVLQGIEQRGSATGLGAIAMIGLLDAALEHFALWHGSQGLPFDEEQFLAFVRERLNLARANIATRLAEDRSALQ